MKKVSLPQINRIEIAGRLTKDPEMMTLSNGETKLTRFSIAVNKYKTDTVMFFNCTCWNKTAEYVAKQKKGCPVIVDGRLEYNKKDDKTYYNLDCHVVHVLEYEANERKKEIDEDIPF